MADKKPFYGGQAVIEGVVMRAPERWAMALRRAQGLVALYLENQPSIAKHSRLARLPLVRGNVVLYEAIALGWRTLQLSADYVARWQAEEGAEYGEPAPVQQGASQASASGQQKSATDQGGLPRWASIVSGILAAAIGIGLFIWLPTWAADWFGRHGSVAKNFIEGGVRLAVIVAYLAGVSLLPDVRRVFQYHGAEHAAINCYEAGRPLTVENCLDCSVLHPRCGTSFILVVVAVKILVNCFLGWPVLWQRLLIRIAVLPLVAGLAYEIIHFAGRHRASLLGRIVAAPGLALEALTTRRPTAEQVAVAVWALCAVAPDLPAPADAGRAVALNESAADRLRELGAGDSRAGAPADSDGAAPGG